MEEDITRSERGVSNLASFHYRMAYDSKAYLYPNDEVGLLPGGLLGSRTFVSSIFFLD